MQGGQTNRSCRRSKAGSEVDERCDLRGIDKANQTDQICRISYAACLLGSDRSVHRWHLILTWIDRRSQTGGKSLWRKEYDHYLSLWTLARIQGRLYVSPIASESATFHLPCRSREDWKDVPWSAPLPIFPSFDLQAQWASQHRLRLLDDHHPASDLSRG